MINLKWLIVTLLGMICFAKAKVVPNISSISQREVTLDDGSKLRCSLAIPKFDSAAKSLPLVVALHYGGRVTPFYGRGFLTLLVEPALRELGAVIIAPDCPGKGWTDPKSENAVLVLIDHFRKEFDINPSQILITGFSLGGIGTWHMAARHGDLFSAAIPVSAMPEADALDSAPDIPFYVIHSRRDEIFPVKKVQDFVVKKMTQGMSIRLEVVDGFGHYETARFVEPLKKAVPWIKELWKEQTPK